MRDIKFRAWNPVTKTMVDLHKITPLVLDKDVSGLFIPFSDGLPIMQYTGLKDKNGKEIYEGDIVLVKLWQRDPQPNYYWVKHVVEWHKSGCRFVISEPNSKECYGFDNTTPFEVIGNIYENPELLKEGE